jgi:small subunit ribosomal protein S16
MATKIRLARGGTKKRPFYRIVIADERAPRDGNFIEKVGNFNPMLPKDHKERLIFSKERIEYWLKVGAQPTERVQKFLSEHGLVEAPKITEKTKQHLPKAKAQERMKQKDEAAIKAEEDAKAAAAAPVVEEPAVEPEATPEAEAAPVVEEPAVEPEAAPVVEEPAVEPEATPEAEATPAVEEPAVEPEATPEAEAAPVVTEAPAEEAKVE